MQYGTSVSELKQARAAGAPARLPDPGPRFTSALVIWVWLFLVCFGLGYVTLNRLDPRNLPGTLDTADYYQMVAGSRRDVEPLMGSRILVAAVARPIARLAERSPRIVEPSLVRAAGCKLPVQCDRRIRVAPDRH
jgi:hypothetical protein